MAQDTGNPVLDSLVNIVMAAPSQHSRADSIESLHATLLKLAEKEPGGLKRRGLEGKLVDAKD